jgi:16S rRNA (guanine527-N7)-methyltransferase
VKSGGEPAGAIEAERSAVLRQFNVSRETAARLDELVCLLSARQHAMNLVAASTLPHLWVRHIADSLQLIPLAGAAQTWVDLGSGGGFPGLVVASALAERSGVHIHLVESTGKKARFLTEAATLIGLPVTIHAERIEQFVRHWRGFADAVTARAVAPLPRLLEYAAPLIERGAKAIFPKGQGAAAELTEAAKSWKFDAELVQSATDSRSQIVIVTRAQRLLTSRHKND